MGSSWTWADLELGSPGTSHCCISLCKCVLTGPGNRVLVRHTHTLSLCWSPLVTTGHHCWSNGGWAPHGPGQSTPGTSHCCISLCKCVLTGPGNRVLVRHTHSLSLCWSPLVTTGHHSGLMGDGLLMDLGRPGIGLSRDLLHLTLQVCSDWSWQQSTGQAHTLTLSLSAGLHWSPLVTTAGLMGDGLLMDLGRPGIGLSRDLSHLTLQVCSDWSWQQSTGQAHTLSLSLLVSTGHHCWSNGGWAPHGPGQTWNWALQRPLTAASHSASVF